MLAIQNEVQGCLWKWIFIASWASIWSSLLQIVLRSARISVEWQDKSGCLSQERIAVKLKLQSSLWRWHQKFGSTFCLQLLSWKWNQWMKYFNWWEKYIKFYLQWFWLFTNWWSWMPCLTQIVWIIWYVLSKLSEHKVRYWYVTD